MTNMGISQVDHYTRWLLDIDFWSENLPWVGNKFWFMREGELLSRFCSRQWYRSSHFERIKT